MLGSNVRENSCHTSDRSNLKGSSKEHPEDPIGPRRPRSPTEAVKKDPGRHPERKIQT